MSPCLKRQFYKLLKLFRARSYVEKDRRLGNLSTLIRVQKLQMALHAKAKAEVGYRFYALYDKIYREDILAHAYACCRANKGAPGVDGQEFADVEAYEVERWLGELTLALREEAYRPAPIRRVYIPKPNGKLRPLGISTLRDRVCMAAAMLVLVRFSTADPPDEQYAYRSGPQRPTGGGRSESTTVSRPPGCRRCRPCGLLRDYSPCRANKVGSTSDS